MLVLSALRFVQNASVVKEFELKLLGLFYNVVEVSKADVTL